MSKKSTNGNSDSNGGEPSDKPDAPESSCADAALHAAEDAVNAAKEQLRRAEELYEKARHAAEEKIEEIRESKVGDVLQSVLETTRKYPGPCLTVAVLVGLYLGRLFRR